MYNTLLFGGGPLVVDIKGLAKFFGFLLCQTRDDEEGWPCVRLAISSMDVQMMFSCLVVIVMIVATIAGYGSNEPTF